MITLKVQKKDGLEYLLALEPADLDDLAVKDAVMTVKLDLAKIHIMQWASGKDALLAYLKEHGGLNESLIIRP